MIRKLYVISSLIISLMIPSFTLLGNFSINLKQKIAKNIVPTWMENQISGDLQSVSSLGHTMNITRELEGWFNKNFAVRYKIINNKISVITTPAKETWPEDQKDAYLRRLALMNKVIFNLGKCTNLPDVDFIVYLNDCFLGTMAPVGPIFGPCKDRHKDRHVVLIPDFHTFEIYPKLVHEVIHGNTLYPWDKKINKGFWRGSTTGAYFTLNNYKQFTRFILVEKSQKFAHLLDARFTNLTQMNNSLKVLMKKYTAPAISIAEHMRYKYQILIDGNGASYPRGYWQMFSNSVMLKPESNSIQWFYSALKPYKHFIPLKADLSNLKDQLMWAINSDKKVKKIAKNAQNFARNNLRLEDNLYYIYILLDRVSKLQKTSL